MEAYLPVLLLCVLSITLSSASTYIHNHESNSRSSRFFPLFSIVKIANQPCTPDEPNAVGTCFTSSQCRKIGGQSSGTCASGFGTCCIVSATCESTVTQNNTNFRTKSYPNAFNPTGLELCNLRIQRPSGNICQVRLDFITMKLSGADQMTGQCAGDRLSITGISGPAPSNLCGDLSGQHMYFNFGTSDRITLQVITDGESSKETRDWNVRVTYIECNSRLLAPDGCLQYFNQATGQVRILGYPMAPHLADLDYTVCVRGEDGSGSIVWSPCQGEGKDVSFFMSGMTADMPGTDCLMDYVLIMTDDPMMMRNNDRYCGSLLNSMMAPFTVRSVAKPFIMRVKTNSDEMGDAMNTGFCLAWRQEPPRSVVG